MPVEKKEVTFVGWLEDLFKLPVRIPRQSIAIFKDGWGTLFAFQLFAIPNEYSASASDLLTAYVEGRESIGDIKGVITTVNLKDIAEKGPVETIKVIGRKTLQQIASIEEIEQDVRSAAIERLTRGYLTDGSESQYADQDAGRSFLEPQSNSLKIMGKLFPLGNFPLTDNNKTSNVQLTVDLDTTPDRVRGDWEDRKIAEEGRSRTTQHKTYASLAHSLQNLANKAEARVDRREAYLSVMDNFNRTIASEHGINLDKVLDTVNSRKEPVEGSLHKVIREHHLAAEESIYDTAPIDTVLGPGLKGKYSSFKPSDKNKIMYMLGDNPKIDKVAQDIVGEKNLTERSKKAGEFFGQSDENWFANLPSADQSSILNFLKNRKSIISSQAVDAAKVESILGKPTGWYTSLNAAQQLDAREMARMAGSSIDKLLADPAKVEEILGQKTGWFSTLSPQEQDHWKVYIKSEHMALRDTSWKPYSQTGYDLLEAWQKDGYGTYLGDTKYTGTTAGGLVKRGAWVAGDLKQERAALAIEYRLMYDFYKARIRKNIAQAASDYALSKGLSAAEASQAANRALERLRTAENALGMGEDLFAASSIKDALEAIRDGDFLKEAIINSRFLNLLPFADKRLRSPAEHMQGLGQYYFAMGQVKELVDEVTKRSGLAFEAEEAEDVLGLGRLTKIESRVFAEIQQKKVIGGKRVPIKKWTPIVIKYTQAQGIFGNYGVYDILNTIQNYDLAGVTGLSLLKPSEYLENLNELESLFNNIVAANGAPGTQPQFDDLIKLLNLDDKKNFNAFLGQRALFDIHGKNWIENTLKVKGLDSKDRWEFLKELMVRGKGQKLGSKFDKLGNLLTVKRIGPLNYYNRAVNEIRYLLYKNVLFGEYGDWIPGIKPVRSFLNRLGFSEEVGLAKAVSTWGWVQKLEIAGKSMLKASSQDISVWRVGIVSLKSKIGRNFAGIIMKLSKKVGGKALIKSLGYLLSAAGGLVTGAISIILSAIALPLLKAGLSILKGKPKEALESLKEEGKKYVGIAKKVVVYPIKATGFSVVYVISCCLSCCLAPIIIIVLIIASMVATFTGTGGYIPGTGTQSSLITVEKTGTYNESARTIDYTVTVNNVSAQDVVISSFDDKMTFVAACTVKKNSTYGELGFPGYVRTVPSSDYIHYLNTFSNLFRGKTIGAGESLSQSFTLEGTIPDGIYGDDGTYVNLITAAAEGEGGKSAISASTVKINDGGCIQCPGGWPATGGTLAVTQGPRATHPDSSHKTTEAADFAPRAGLRYRTILATHEGTLIAGSNDLSCVNKNGKDYGYGCYVDVVSADGRIRTRYAHMVKTDQYDLNGMHVSRGTPIGIMGNTGYSTGTHLHYEFRTPNNQCIPGVNLRLINVSGEEYVPTTIKYGCFGALDCALDIVN